MNQDKIKQQIKTCANFTNDLCSRWYVPEPVSTEKYTNLINLISATDAFEAEELRTAVKHLLQNGTLQKNVFSLGRICAIINILSKKYADAGGAKRVFISHSSKDKDIIRKFVEKVLRLGCSVESSDIFCTSIEDMGIRTGDDIRKHIKESMRSCDCVFLMISENYINSSMCLNEMGASWALDKNVKPLLFPGVTYNAIWLSAALLNSNLHESATLDSLRDDLISEFDLKLSSTSDWNKQKDAFLNYLNSSVS